MSPSEIDERFEEIVLELRATQLAAPPELRERVRALEPEAVSAPPRRRLPLRRAALVAVPVAVVLAAAGALVGGLVTSDGGSRRAAPNVDHGAGSARAQTPLRAAAPPAASVPFSSSAKRPGGAPLTPSAGRAQQYDADLDLRVKNLSRATKAALGITRQLGGYVRSVHYDDGRSAGGAELVVRIPLRAVQSAIVRFSALGTILTQRIDLRDLQPKIDARFERLQALRRAITKLQHGKLDEAAQRKLARLRARLKALQAEQAQTVRRASYATVSLGLTETTARKPVPQPAHPTRIDRALDRAGAILLDEAVVVLYVLVVGGPIALLAALFLAGGRALRRRGETRLLERS